MNSVQVEKIADFGAGEPFVARIVMGLGDILNVTEFENKEEINEAIMELFMNGLAPAFVSLQEIRAMESGEKEKLGMNLRKEYFSFYDRVWAAYKDRMQKVTSALGYDIGFIFSDEKKYLTKSENFFSIHTEVPRELEEAIRQNRINWQNAVVRFRNEYAQHHSIYEEEIQQLMTLPSAEICFRNCWTAIEMILAHLLCTRLSGFAGVEEIPESDRDQSVPKRFRIIYRMNQS